MSALGCGHTQYVPHVVARGEIVLSAGANLQMSAASRPIASGLGWKGLEQFVRCVPASRTFAHRARRDGLASRTMTVVASTLAVASVGSLAGLADEQHEVIWLGAGVGTAGLAVLAGGLSRMLRNRANGQAVDAMNIYNDSVGSLGATCDDLTYPPPAARPQTSQ
jgi:hypothetical protein